MSFKVNDYVAFNITGCRGLGYIYQIANSKYYRVMVLTCSYTGFEGIDIYSTFPFTEQELRLANEEEFHLISKMLIFK